VAEVWIVRHAETAWSRAGRHTGRTDIELTPEGRERAAALGVRLGGRRFGRVLVSPLRRARETARLAGLEPGAEVRAELLEWDYGEYEGITTADVRARRPGWDLWRDGCPGGEGPADVAARCDRLVAELAEAEGDVCCVAHGHVLRALASRWLQRPVDLGGQLPLATGAIGILGVQREVRALTAWNA
jgi:probable phosphoglycerate mutase